jgi:hypothetical protein
MLEKMRSELESAGHSVKMVAVNDRAAAGVASTLSDVSTYPVFQDTEQVKAWEQHRAGKDDMMIYDRKGILLHYLPINGTIDSVLSKEPGYGNVKNLLIAASDSK